MTPNHSVSEDVACSLDCLMFSLPFANCVIVQSAALLGHFDMLLISCLVITVFLPNDHHGKEFFGI